jgi:hypothetical protein
LMDMDVDVDLIFGDLWAIDRTSCYLGS